MVEYKAEFIKVNVGPGFVQTAPVEPQKRLPDSSIRIEPCTNQDATKIAEGLYICFSDVFWDKMEPRDRRPDRATQVRRMSQRLVPSLLDPNVRWIKAVNTSSGEIMGVAGWTVPGAPLHNHFLRSAVEFYGWREKMGWSKADVDEIWEHVDDAAWNGQTAEYDVIRKSMLGDEPHWFLAPLITWPEYQGRGVGKKLLMWAIEQADATVPPTPMYLESAPTARAVYMHCGFVPQGKVNFVRRGPAIVREAEGEEVAGKKVEKVDVEVVAKEMEGAMDG